MVDSIRRLSEERLAEIRARLTQKPPVRAVPANRQGKNIVASYLSALCNDQLDLVHEIDRLRLEAEIHAQMGANGELDPDAVPR